MKLGILYICTGKYEIFWKDFYLSMEKNFVPEAEKHYFVFTDAPEIEFEKGLPAPAIAGRQAGNPRIHRILQENLGWPDNTLMRFDMFLKQENALRKMDYLYFMNADLLCIAPISFGEISPKDSARLVATLHPGYFNKPRRKFPYEKNKESAAYIPENAGTRYVAGGFNGGYADDFIAAMKKMSTDIAADKQKNITAVWHDESHWNKYISKRNDVTFLSPSYLYPESAKLSVIPKIIIRDKRKYFDYAAAGKAKNNASSQNIKDYFKQISFIRNSSVWIFAGKWIRRIKFIKTFYRFQKKQAFRAYLNNDKEYRRVKKDIGKYLAGKYYEFNGIKIPKEALTVDNLFNVLLPHAENISYQPDDIEKYYDELRKKYPTLIYWKEILGNREPDYIGAHLISHGFTYLFKEINIEKNDVVFDIGAAPGDFCALSAAKGASAVYAFEPEKIGVKLLKKVSGLNDNKITVIQKYCGDRSGTDMIKIDDFVEENKIEKVSFIKMDVEGAETGVLSGAQKTLKEKRPKLAICTYHNLADEKNIEKIILTGNKDYVIYRQRGIIYAY